MTGHFGGWGISQNNVGQVDANNGNLTSPSQVDDDLLEFNRVSGCVGWYRVLDALADVDHHNTALVVSCATATATLTCWAYYQIVWNDTKLGRISPPSLVGRITRLFVMAHS